MYFYGWGITLIGCLYELTQSPTYEGSLSSLCGPSDQNSEVVSVCNKLVVWVIRFCRKPSLVTLVHCLQCASAVQGQRSGVKVLVFVLVCMCIYVCVGMGKYMYVCVHVCMCVWGVRLCVRVCLWMHSSWLLSVMVIAIRFKAVCGYIHFSHSPCHWLSVNGDTHCVGHSSC